MVRTALANSCLLYTYLARLMLWVHCGLRAPCGHIRIQASLLCYVRCMRAHQARNDLGDGHDRRS